MPDNTNPVTLLLSSSEGRRILKIGRSLESTSENSMVDFPAPPLEPLLSKSLNQTVQDQYSSMRLPLDLFQAFFYSTLGFVGVDRLVDLASRGLVPPAFAYAAVAAIVVLSAWLTLRVVFVLASLIAALLGRILPEAVINRGLFAARVIVFILAMIFQVAFALNSRCALLNECSNPTIDLPR